MYYPLFSEKVLGQMANFIIHDGARKVVRYLTDKEVIKATRRLYGGKIDNRNKRIEILYTIGRPNYTERSFIKKIKKAKEKYPIAQVYFPKKVKK